MTSPQKGSCCEQCNINTAPFSKRHGREPNKNGCLNVECKCHTTTDHLGKANNMVAPISDDGWVDNTVKHFGALFGNFLPSLTQEQIVKAWLRAALLEAEKKGRDIRNERIYMLRQWINEDRITDPKRMITNENIKHWLGL